MGNNLLKLLLTVLIGSAVCLFVSGCAKKSISTAPGEVVSGSSEQGTGGTNQTPPAGETASAVQKQNQVSEYDLEQEKAKKAQEEAAKLVQLKEQLGRMIYFDFDSYELKPEAREILKTKAELLNAHPELKLVIEGHCDERGTEEYNLALGERRARAAYEFLILLGVDADRLTIISYGEERPLDPGHTEMAWAKNRRDEFKVVQ